MNERRISILIDTQGNVSGIDKVSDAYARLQSQGDALFGALKAGVAIDIGGRLVGSIAQIPDAMDRAIERGVQFNAVLETSALGIAAVLKQFDTAGKFKTFDDAMVASAGAIDLLKQKAKESPATFQSLVQSYQALAGPLSAANIPMEKQVDLIVNMSQALSGLGISSQQLLQETRALVTGNINADAAAAKILGISAADVSGAKARGQLYEFLSGKISSFAEAGKRGAQTYQTAASNLEDAIDDVLAKVTKPIFEAMTKGTLDLSAALNDPAIVNSLREIGEGIASLVKSGYDLTQFAIENRDALIFLAKAATALGVAYAAVNITHLLLGLGLKTVALVKSKLAIDAETAALTRNTAAQVANGAARVASAAAGNYGRAAGAMSAAAAQAQVARATNLGQYATPTVVRAAYAGGAVAPEAVAGVTGVAAIAAVVVPLAIAAAAGFLIRAQINAAAAARDRRINEQGAGYGADTSGNAKAMASMATTADKLAVYERLRTQEAKVQQDIYEAIGAGDAQRVQMAEQQLKFLQLQRSQVDAVFDRVNALNGVEAQRVRLLRESQEFLKKSLADRDARAARLPETKTAYDDARFDSVDDAGKLGILANRRAQLPSDEATDKMAMSIQKMPLGLERDAANQTLIETRTKILLITQQQAAVEADIAKKIADQFQEITKQKQARADYVLDVQIVEARVKGLDKVADRLENEKKLREEIRRVMEATGASEEEAERAARRKLSAEWQLEQKKSGLGQASGTTIGASSGGFRPGITGGIQTHQISNAGRIGGASIGASDTISPFDDRYNFGNVVPRIRPKSGASVSGASADFATIADTVNKAADAVKSGSNAVKLEALQKALAELGAAITGKQAVSDAKLAAIVQQVQQLTTQISATRTRGGSG